MKKLSATICKKVKGLLATTFFMLLSSSHLVAQTALPLKQQSLAQWHIGAAQYSGITALGNNRYALVSDKEPTDGFFIFKIEQSKLTGQITHVQLEEFRGNKKAKVDANGICIRDCEGVAYFPTEKTIFISGEGDQKILEYSLATGQPTGRELNIPTAFSTANIYPNYGFEALCYDNKHHLFWTTSESTLRSDGYAVSALTPTTMANVLRLQAFDNQLQPVKQYAYRMDNRQISNFGKIYVNGVTSLTALSDGRLLVLEREANVTPAGLGSKVICKLFVVDPSNGNPINATTKINSEDFTLFLKKQLLAEWQTAVYPFKIDFANYEGMCLGQTLHDGRQTLLLVNDSQGGYRKGPFRLKDYIKVIVIGH